MGPLSGVKVLELAGIGPAPFGCMVLAEMGAEVIRVDRMDGRTYAQWHRVLDRGRRSIALDIKHPHGREIVLRLAENADVMVEGFRPGVAERLGVGPQDCRNRHPGLIYARMTGWGQGGPLAATAGHDINYLALSGALHAIGHQPLNLLGDFGAGGMLLANGVLAALVERHRSGVGQVVDVSIVDGVVSLMAMHVGMLQSEQWRMFTGQAPFYGLYECADRERVAVGALEEPFFQALVSELGVCVAGDRWDPATWPVLKEQMAQRFATRNRDEWAQIFDGTDACVTPVLSVSEAASHPHLVFRGNYDAELVPAAAPRFARSVADPPSRAPEPGADTTQILAQCGLSRSEIEALLSAGIARSS
jgi:alpha-methylacyl-CoA racemase